MCIRDSYQPSLRSPWLAALEVEDSRWQESVDIHDPGWVGKWIKEYNKAENKYKANIKTLIGWGAKFEDEATATRPKNHFFDPVRNEAISMLGMIVP